MCCSKRRQQRLERQTLYQVNPPVSSYSRGCCGTRKALRLQRELETQTVSNYPASASQVTSSRPQDGIWSNVRDSRHPMAALLVVSIGIGAEKVGRKISEKRLERKDRKAAEQRELMYGSGESSSANSAARTKVSSRQERKSEEARREQESERRRSVSSERTLLPENPPPRYEEVIRNDARHAPHYA